MSKILHIENDLEITGSFQEMIGDIGAEWQVEVVRHMAEAQEKIRQVKDYDAYIIDVMLPRNAVDLEMLEPLELDRLNKLDKLTSVRTHSNEGREEGFVLRKQIAYLDVEIDKYLNKEGGIELLTLICMIRDDHIKDCKLHLPVIFWTARSAPELKNICEEQVHKDFLRWIEKPEDEEIVHNIIKDLLKVA